MQGLALRLVGKGRRQAMVGGSRQPWVLCGPRESQSWAQLVHAFSAGAISVPTGQQLVLGGLNKF